MSEKEIELKTETIKKLQKKVKALEKEMEESIENIKSEMESIDLAKKRLKKRKHVYSMTNNEFEKVTEAISEYFNKAGYNYGGVEERERFSVSKRS